MLGYFERKHQEDIDKLKNDKTSISIYKKVYDKLSNEYISYISNLKLLDKDKIIEKSYETTIKEEIVAMFYPDNNYFAKKYLKKLLRSSNSLDELYNIWMDNDKGLNEVIEDIITDDYINFLDNCEEKEI